jgi:hypothetical protein
MSAKGDARCFVPYNGGFGAEQLDWMADQITDAAVHGDVFL